MFSSAHLNRKEDGETGKKLISSFKIMNDFFMSNVYYTQVNIHKVDDNNNNRMRTV